MPERWTFALVFSAVAIDRDEAERVGSAIASAVDVTEADETYEGILLDPDELRSTSIYRLGPVEERL